MSVPPKAAPFPFGTTPGSTTASSGEATRQSLRHSITQRRRTLTRQESKFLEELCDNGNEIEVQLAHQKLMDDDLFFEHEGDGWSSDDFFVGREHSARSSAEKSNDQSVKPPVPRSIGQMRQSSTSSLGSNLGSSRRQLMLETRRKSALFGSIWRAHESGLAVSGGSSRRSVLARRNSGILSVGSSLNLASSPKVEDIFRSTAQQQSSQEESKGDYPRSSSMKLPSRASLQRLTSTGSRKSVTFGTLPPSPRKSFQLSGGQSSFASLRKAEPLRSDSIGSIPSLYQANSVHSNASIPSLPPIRKAHRVFSDGSIKSLALSDITTTDESPGLSVAPVAFEEKKSEEAQDSPIPDKVEIVPLGTAAQTSPIKNATKLLQHQGDLSRPVLLREASKNNYDEAGMEVTDFGSFVEAKDPLHLARQMDSLVSFNDAASALSRSSSFDETVSLSRLNSIFRRTSAALVRSLSDDESNGIFLDGTRLRAASDANMSTIKDQYTIGEEDSWQMKDDGLDYYDSWMVIKDEYENGYGGGGTLGFSILGTSADDVAAHPHVLSPPLMESLQSFLPWSKSGENFWLKYSMVRDGSSIHSFLQNARGAQHSVLAIETVDGEVFGAFTAEPWRKNWNYFGSGESFLWRMRHTRKEKSHSIIDQAHMESEIDVYPYTGVNASIQLCTHDMVAVGGGNAGPDTPLETALLNHGSPIRPHEWGFGLTIRNDMMSGTSSPCITFGSPSLSVQHADGSPFEIINVELWTLTPCIKLEDAEKLELGKLFLQQHSQ